MSSQPRQYRSALRTEQAAQTRRRVLAAAADLFATKGYGGTTLADIARQAGVSVETVQGQGPKRDLLLGAFEQAFGGTEGPQLITEQPVGLDILETDSVDELIRRIVDFVAAANARTSGLSRAFSAAAERDPHVRAAIEDLFARRRRDMTAAIKAFEDRGARITNPQQQADLLSFLLSPEGYHQLVVESGWSMELYRQWLVLAITDLVRGTTVPPRTAG
jgi:AcrR family transcriptional regulator